MKKLAIALIVMVGLLVIAAALLDTHIRAQERASWVGPPWDVVVLGRIDACWVCQFGPSPHVRYTQVLAGKVPSSQARGELALVAVAERLLPEGGIPIYKSQKEEICFLKRIVVPDYEAADVYEVVDVMEATPENLARFRGR
jgi:hypothetical protein